MTSASQTHLTLVNGVELRFDRRGDRIAHALVAANKVIVSSLEGDDSENWPPSPPLQQLSIESPVGTPVAFLVGMAGKSHWSMAVESTPQGELRFDAACKVRGEQGALGAAYQLQADTTCHDEPAGLRLEAPGCVIKLGADDSPGCEPCDFRYCPDDHSVRIAVSTPIEDGRTYRWRYRVSV